MLVRCEDIRRGEGKPEFHGVVDHLRLLGDDLGAPSHPPQRVACMAVILLDSDGSRLADDMACWGQVFGQSIPVVSLEDAIAQVFDLVVELPERYSITTADHPGKRSPCATIHRLDDPAFVCFEPMTCHMSSNSMSLMSPAMAGCGSLAISSPIQR